MQLAAPGIDMAPWLRLLEGWAVEQLLRTPGFHRAVEKVAKNVHRVRNGLPREEPGGTSIDRPDGPGFGQHFFDELKTQLGRAERSEHTSTMLRDESKIFENKSTNAHMSGSHTAKEEGSDAAWRDIQRQAAEPPKQGFMNEYMDAIRSQLRNEKPKPEFSEAMGKDHGSPSKSYQETLNEHYHRPR